MRLEKASSATLIAWILIPTAILAVYLSLVVLHPNPYSFIYAVVIVPVTFVAIITGWALDDSDGPILEIDDRGISMNSVFATEGRIPWADVERLHITSVRYGLLRVPIVSHLVIQLRDSSHIAPMQWFFPNAWFGRIAIPVRFISGGRSAANRAIMAAQSGIMQGEIDVTRKSARSDDFLKSGDAAIARTLAARGGMSTAHALPRSIDDLGTGTEAAMPPRAIPQGYGEAPEIVPLSSPAPQSYAEEPARVPQPLRQPAEPVMTVQHPAPIMVNGVPYQPQRVGGFGRKRV